MRKDVMQTCIVPIFLWAILIEIPQFRRWDMDELRKHFDEKRTVDGYASLTHASDVVAADPTKASPAFTGHIIDLLVRMFALDPRNETSIFHHPQPYTDLRTVPHHVKVPWSVLVNATAMANYLTRRLTKLLEGVPRGATTHQNINQLIMPDTFIDPSEGFFRAFEGDQVYALDHVIDELDPRAGSDASCSSPSPLKSHLLEMDEAWAEWCVKERGCRWSEIVAPPPPLDQQQRNRHRMTEADKDAGVGDRVYYEPGGLVRVLLPPEGGASLHIF